MAAAFAPSLPADPAAPAPGPAAASDLAALLAQAGGAPASGPDAFAQFLAPANFRATASALLSGGASAPSWNGAEAGKTAARKPSKAAAADADPAPAAQAEIAPPAADPSANPALISALAADPSLSAPPPAAPDSACGQNAGAPPEPIAVAQASSSRQILAFAGADRATGARQAADAAGLEADAGAEAGGAVSPEGPVRTPAAQDLGADEISSPDARGEADAGFAAARRFAASGVQAGSPSAPAPAGSPVRTGSSQGGRRPAAPPAASVPVVADDPSDAGEAAAASAPAAPRGPSSNLIAFVPHAASSPDAGLAADASSFEHGHRAQVIDFQAGATPAAAAPLAAASAAPAPIAAPLGRLSPAATPGAKIAVNGSGETASVVAFQSGAQKDALSPKNQGDAKQPLVVGIDGAKSSPVMPAPSYSPSADAGSRVSVLEAPAASPVAGGTALSAAAASPSVSATAHQAVEAVARLVDAQAARAQGAVSSVNLSFKVGGEDLGVRVEMRGGEVRAQFSTDSATLRSAIATEWQSIGATAPGGRSFHYADPVFVSSGLGGRPGDAAADGRGQEQAARFQSPSDSPRGGSGRPAPSAPARSGSSGARAAASPAAAGRLRTFA